MMPVVNPNIQKRPFPSRNVPLQGTAPKTEAPSGRHLCGLERGVSRRNISTPTGIAI